MSAFRASHISECCDDSNLSHQNISILEPAYKARPVPNPSIQDFGQEGFQEVLTFQ